MATLVERANGGLDAHHRAPQGGGLTAFSNTDWDTYVRCRPVYPQSLLDIVNTYHQTHGDPSTTRIVDLGSGTGVAITRFAQYYDILHVSDPSADNIKKASQFVPDFLNKNGLKAKVEYSQSLAEEASKHISPGTADLVIAATAAHFMKVDEMIDSVAEILHPGGTMAIFTYSWPRFPTESKRFQDSFTKAFDEVFASMRHSHDDNLRGPLNRCVTHITAGEGLLSYLPMPDKYFKDKERVIINSSNGEGGFSERFKRLVFLPGEMPGESRVQPDEKIIRFRSGQDLSAEGWTEPVDKQFLLNFLQSMRPLGAQVADPEFDKLIVDFDRVFDEEIGRGGYAIPCWPASVCLATRK